MGWLDRLAQTFELDAPTNQEIAAVLDAARDVAHGVERKITPGDVIVIRYEGPHANGMPEMYFAAAILAADPALSHTTAIVTDGRYSGAMQGPCVGHVTPEALDGGPIALVEENDLIELNVPDRSLAVVGVDGQRRPEDEVAAILAERRGRWSPRPPRHTRGILSLYERISSDGSHGAYYSEEAIGTVRRFAAEEVVRVVSGRPPLSPVNAGELVQARWSRSA